MSRKRITGISPPKGYRDKDEGNKWQKNVRWSQPKLSKIQQNHVNSLLLEPARD